MAFGQLTITAAGKELYSAALDGNVLKFTGVAIGDGKCKEEFATKEQLEHPLFTVGVEAKIEKTECVLMIDLGEYETEYYFREIGVLAEDKDGNQILYAYDNAGDEAEYIDTNHSILREKRIKIILKLESSKEITIETSSVLYATYADIKKLENMISHHGRVFIGNGKTELNRNDTLFLIEPDAFLEARISNLVIGDENIRREENWGTNQEGNLRKGKQREAVGTLENPKEDANKQDSFLEGKLTVADQPKSDTVFFAHLEKQEG